MEQILNEKQQQHLAGVSIKSKPSKEPDRYDGYLDREKHNRNLMRTHLKEAKKDGSPENKKHKYRRRPVIVNGDYKRVITMPKTYAHAYKLLDKYSYRKMMFQSVAKDLGIGEKALKYLEKLEIITRRKVKDEIVITVVGNKIKKEPSAPGRLVIMMPKLS